MYRQVLAGPARPQLALSPSRTYYESPNQVYSLLTLFSIYSFAGQTVDTLNLTPASVTGISYVKETKTFTPAASSGDLTFALACTGGTDFTLQVNLDTVSMAPVGS